LSSWRITLAVVAAEMLARTGALFNAPEVYDMPVHRRRLWALFLNTSGLLEDALALIDDDSTADS
jgi:hypothetical protein